MKKKINLYSIKKIFIHIGLHKTGTSSIQNILFNNHKKLIKKKILYPKTITSINFNKENKLILEKNPKNLFDHNPIEDVKYSNFNNNLFYRDLENEIKDNPNCDTLILSAENLYYTEKKKINELKFLFKDTKVKIIFVRRNYFDWLDSIYFEKIFSGQSCYSFDVFFHKFKKSNLIPFEKKINLWKQNFNSNNFIEINYKKNSNFIRQFLSKLEIPKSIIKDIKNKKIYNYSKNPSYLIQIALFNRNNNYINDLQFIKKKIKFIKSIKKKVKNNNHVTFICFKKYNHKKYKFLENLKNNKKFYDTSILSKEIKNIPSLIKYFRFIFKKLFY
jgi:hypothetical protein